MRTTSALQNLRRIKQIIILDQRLRKALNVCGKLKKPVTWELVF
jgi:hypothetical protein